jgi:predicted nuclease with TOPRIM domain
MLNTEKILQEKEEENNKLKATIEKLIKIREENAKLKQLIANMENEQRDFTTKATVHQTLPNLADLDEIMIVEETSNPKRTRDVQTNSWSSGTGSPKTKKVNTEKDPTQKKRYPTHSPKTSALRGSNTSR